MGGVKLGVGGLTSAYRTAAHDSLSQATLIAREVEETVELSFDYPATAYVKLLVRDFDLAIREQDYKERCTLVVQLRLRHREAFLKKIVLLNARGMKILLAS